MTVLVLPIVFNNVNCSDVKPNHNMLLADTTTMRPADINPRAGYNSSGHIQYGQQDP